MYPLYATVLAAAGDPAELAPAVVGRLADWLSDAGLGAVDLSCDGSASLRNLAVSWRADEGGQVEIAHALSAARGSATTTRVHLAAERRKIRVVVTVERRQRGHPRPPELDDVPAVVTDLLGTGWFGDGGVALRGTATVVGVDGVGALVDDLHAPDRRYPVLVLSEPPDSPHSLHRRAERMLTGLAHLRVLDTGASWKLSDAVGRHHSCFGGAARVYWRMADDSRPDDNPYWPLDTLRVDQDRIFQWLRHRLTAAVAATLPDVGPVTRARGEVDVAEVPAGSRAGWDALHDRIATLERDLQAAEVALEAVGEDREFAIVGEAVAAATRAFPELVWLPEAQSSADASPYRNPDRVFGALGALAEAAARWRRDALPGGFVAFFAQAGIRYGMDVSEVARGRWPGDYRRRWDGRDVWLGPHLKLGSGPPANHCRIYWYADAESRQVVVGHVGVHLTDTATDG
jgi:hypothetical protein